MSERIKSFLKSWGMTICLFGYVAIVIYAIIGLFRTLLGHGFRWMYAAAWIFVTMTLGWAFNE